MCLCVALLYVYCMFTVYITSLIQGSHSATIVSIRMLVYLLYFCVSVFMYMFLYKTSLFVNCIMFMYSGPEAAYNQINQINQSTHKQRNSRTPYVVSKFLDGDEGGGCGGGR